MYRGYKSQSKISQELGIPKQSWNLWERGVRNPGLANISAICNFLAISPLFFFSDESNISKYDNRSGTGDEDSLPFVRTEITEQISQFLDMAASTAGIYLIDTPGEIGVTRAIYEWTHRQAAKRLLIFDHTGYMSPQTIIEHIAREDGTSKVFVKTPGRTILPEGITFTSCLHFEMIGYRDFKNIILAALPGVSLPLVTLLITDTGYSLKKLSRLIKRIEQEQENPKWRLNFNSVMKLCESLKKPIYKIRSTLC